MLHTFGSGLAGDGLLVGIGGDWFAKVEGLDDTLEFCAMVGGDSDFLCAVEGGDGPERHSLAQSLVLFVALPLFLHLSVIIFFKPDITITITPSQHHLCKTENSLSNSRSMYALSEEYLSSTADTVSMPQIRS